MCFKLYLFINKSFERNFVLAKCKGRVGSVIISSDNIDIMVTVVRF